MAKQIEISETTTVIKKHFIDKGQFTMFNTARKRAAKALGVAEPSIRSMEVCTSMMTDGYRHDVIKITWQRP